MICPGPSQPCGCPCTASNGQQILASAHNAAVVKQGAEENGDSSPVQGAVQGPLQPGETTPLLLPAPPLQSPSQSPFSAPTFKYNREDQPYEVRLLAQLQTLACCEL